MVFLKHKRFINFAVPMPLAAVQALRASVGKDSCPRPESQLQVLRSSLTPPIGEGAHVDVILASSDSLWLLRKARSDAGLGLTSVEGGPRPHVPHATELAALRGTLPGDFRTFGPDSPLELTSLSREGRPRLRSVRAHASLVGITEGTYLLVTGLPEGGPRIYVEGPALTLAHMASRLGQAVKREALTEEAAFFRLMGLASELCGTYGRDPANPAKGECSWGIDALCSSDELLRSLGGIPGVRGVRPARQAAGLVIPGSASPAESLLAMAMSLPADLGGVPFPAFRHNQALPWPQDFNGLIKHQTMTPDFYWPQHSVALEYDGTRHAEEDRVWEDHRRQQDYTTCGITLLCAQAEDLRSAGTLERLMRIVALQLASRGEAGFLQKVEAALLEPGSSAARATLLSQLLPSVQDLQSTEESPHS